MNWRTDTNHIGTVVGETGTGTYSFVLKSFEAKVGDIVATPTEIPDMSRGREKAVVWGRITAIQRFNPFFPAEAAQELAAEGMDLIDTVLSNSRDHLEATVLVLGSTVETDIDTLDLNPLTYPVQPASGVYTPPGDLIQKLLVGNRKGPRLRLGTLIGRTDVAVEMDANKVVARHMAILAMTGGGKTVAARRVIKELVDQKYPVVIFDPHGDYLGLYERRSHLGAEVKLMYPAFMVTDDTRHLVVDLVTKMGRTLTDPQLDLLTYTAQELNVEQSVGAAEYIGLLMKKVQSTPPAAKDKTKTEQKGRARPQYTPATTRAVIRSLRFVQDALNKMESNNERLRKDMSDFDFTKMPDARLDPEEIVSRGQVTIFYLAGYDHITQSTIMALILEELFMHRSTLSGRIPPFQAVIEEAHNFIPSRSEGQDNTPSLETVRRVITEGRKFGTGLLVISQRPSRLDETILSQCNTFLVLRLVNPKDKSFVRSVMENLSESDAGMLQSFGPGQGLVSGQAVRFPMIVKIAHDKDLESSRIGEETFIEDASNWKPRPRRQANAGVFSEPLPSKGKATHPEKTPSKLDTVRFDFELGKD